MHLDSCLTVTGHCSASLKKLMVHGTVAAVDVLACVCIQSSCNAFLPQLCSIFLRAC